MVRSSTTFETQTGKNAEKTELSRIKTATWTQLVLKRKHAAVNYTEEEGPSLSTAQECFFPVQCFKTPGACDQ